MNNVFKILSYLLKEGNKHQHDYIKRINMHFHNTAAEETEQYENQQDNISIARTTVESSRLALCK